MNEAIDRTRTPPQVLIISRVVLDEIADPELATRRLVLGGSGFWAAYGAATVAERVAVASRVGPDFDPFREQIARLGISDEALLAVAEDTSRTRVTYLTQERRHEEFVGGWQAHVRMRADLEDVPRPTREAPALYVFRDLPNGFWGPVLERVRAGARLLWEIPAAVCARGLGPDVRSVLTETSILSINAEEATTLIGPAEPGETVRRLHTLGPDTVLLRRGRAGALVSRRGRRIWVSTAAVEVVDPTGAGNAFSGAFLAADHLGHDLAGAARIATAVAATAIEQVGPPASREQARTRTSTLGRTVRIEQEDAA